MRRSRVCTVKVLFFAAIVGLQALPAWTAPPPAPAASQFAPAGDLLQQVDYFMARVDESLAEAAGFDLAKQARTEKDGNTLAALALVLAMHDEVFAEKAQMPAMLRSAQRLAAAGSDYQAARAAHDEIQQARQGKAAAAAPAQWEKSANLAALMKQVPVIHSRLKRGVSGNRLKRQAVESAGQAATLAAIAQTSMYDAEFVKSPADAEQWYDCCAQMRDAAGAVNAAVRAADAARVEAGMARLFQSCEKCHATFRVGQ